MLHSRSRTGAPARAKVGAAMPATTTMRPSRPRPRPRPASASSNKSAPPATTTAPRPPKPPSTAPEGPSSAPKPPLSPPKKGGGSGTDKPTPPPPHLENPIAIAASASRTLAVPDRGGLADGSEDLSLEAYMRLPPSAYSALDPELIRRGGGESSSSSSSSSSSVPSLVALSPPEPLPASSSSTPTALFTLAVPRASMLGIWLEPVVSVRVEGATAKKKKNGGGGEEGATPTSPSDRVRLVSTACDLRGSPAVERLKINQVFALRFEALLTWTSGGAITARVRTEVWAEPVGPFRLVPRGAVAAAGDALLRGLTAALLPSFLGKLGDDFQKWARDPGYRREREAMAREAEEREKRGGGVKV